MLHPNLYCISQENFLNEFYTYKKFQKINTYEMVLIIQFYMPCIYLFSFILYTFRHLADFFRNFDIHLIEIIHNKRPFFKKSSEISKILPSVLYKKTLFKSQTNFFEYQTVTLPLKSA